MKHLGEVNTIGEAWISFLKEVDKNGVIKEYSEDEIIKEETALSISIKKAKFIPIDIKLKLEDENY